MLVIKNEITTRFLAVFLLGFFLFAAIHGIIMDDSIKEVQAVQTGSETIQSPSETVEEEDETCPPMEALEGVEAPDGGISVAVVASMFGDMSGVAEIDRETLATSLRRLQSGLLEFLESREVRDSISDDLESELHSAIVLFEEELIRREQLREEIELIIDSLEGKICYGVPSDFLTNMGVPESLVEKYLARVKEGKEVQVSTGELVELAGNIAERK